MSYKNIKKRDKTNEAIDEELEEGLVLLLGGISSDIMKTTVWTVDHNEEDDHGESHGNDCQTSQTIEMEKSPPIHASSHTTTSQITSPLSNKPNYIHEINFNDQNNDILRQQIDDTPIFDRSSYMDPIRGNLLKPPVKIVNMSHINNKGNILIATQPIQRGQIIFTEKAVESAQIPSPKNIYHDDSDETSKHSSTSQRQKQKNQQKKRQIYEAKGCQQCFKSLEPISCFNVRKPNNKEATPNIDKNQNQVNSNGLYANDSAEFGLPMPHLWPIQEYKNNLQSKEDHHDYYNASKIQQPSICIDCGASFCSKQCHEIHNSLMGSCCILVNVIWNVYNTIIKYEKMRGGCTSNNDDDHDRHDVEVIVDPAIILASRMFCSYVNQYRQNTIDLSINPNKQHSFIGKNPIPNKFLIQKEEGKVIGYPFYTLCGEASDITKLEIGILVDQYNDINSPSFQSKAHSMNHCDDENESNLLSNANYGYTLQHVYSALVDTLSLTTAEKEIGLFSLNYFHRLTSVVARNGVNIQTRSPFKEYYSALLRNCPGGRGSSKHLECMKQIAFVLGAEDGATLDRHMDRYVEDRCAIKTISVFTLTSFMNHSCDPSAQIQSQVFADNRIDVMALKDICAGDEITISYINVNKNAGRIATDKCKRKRELFSKYLFLCDCVRCK